MDPLLATIIIFAGNFAPKGWAFCQGQLLSIQQNAALFSLLGTTYGGDGRSNFALPDLRGRVAVSQGQGPGLSNYFLGQQAGSESVQLSVAQMPSHGHNVVVNAGAGNQASPSGNFIANSARGTEGFNSASSGAFLNQNSIQPQGGSQPHANLQPLLAINYIIATQGIFPSRD